MACDASPRPYQNTFKRQNVGTTRWCRDAGRASDRKGLFRRHRPAPHTLLWSEGGITPDDAGEGGRARGVILDRRRVERGPLRLIDSCITQLKAQGPSRTCNESKEEEGGGGADLARAHAGHDRARNQVSFPPHDRCTPPPPSEQRERARESERERERASERAREKEREREREREREIERARESRFQA